MCPSARTVIKMFGSAFPGAAGLIFVCIALPASPAFKVATEAELAMSCILDTFYGNTFQNKFHTCSPRGRDVSKLDLPNILPWAWKVPRYRGRVKDRKREAGQGNREGRKRVFPFLKFLISQAARQVSAVRSVSWICLEDLGGGQCCSAIG